jgi:hypothetical protein
MSRRRVTTIVVIETWAMLLYFFEDFAFGLGPDE